MTTTCSRTSRWPHRIGPLTFLESLNVRMDLLAKSIAQTIHFRLLAMARLLLDVLWFALIYSERCTSTYIIKTWSTFWRIIYLLMSSECIQIWLGTHSAKQEKNAPSRCRSSFPAKTQQLDSSWNVGYNASLITAHAAVRTTGCRSRLSTTFAYRFRELANRRRNSLRYCWLSSHRSDLLVWGSIWDRICNSFYHSFHPAHLYNRRK